MSSGRSRIIWICFYHDNFIIHGYWTVFITLIPQACFGYGYERLLFLCVPSAFIYPGYRNHFYYHIPTFLIPNGYFKVIFISIPNAPIFSGYSSSIFLYIPLFLFSCGYYEFLSISIPLIAFDLMYDLFYKRLTNLNFILLRYLAVNELWKPNICSATI